MSTTVYMNRRGKPRDRFNENCVAITLKNDGNFELKSTPTSNVLGFSAFADLQKMLKHMGYYPINPPRMQLLLYYSSNGKTVVTKEEAAYSIMPSGSEFKAYYLGEGEHHELVRAKFDACRKYVEKHANSIESWGGNGNRASNTIYCAKNGRSGVPVEEATYQFDQLDDYKWVLYSLSNGTPNKLCEGPKRYCDMFMLEQIQRERMAQTNVAPAVPVPVIPVPKVEVQPNLSSTMLRRERHAFRTLKAFYYGEDLALVGESPDNPPASALYKVHHMTNGKWRLSVRSDEKNQSSRISFTMVAIGLEFVDRFAAEAYLYLYHEAKSLEFFDIRWSASSFECSLLQTCSHSG